MYLDSSKGGMLYRISREDRVLGQQYQYILWRLTDMNIARMEKLIPWPINLIDEFIILRLTSLLHLCISYGKVIALVRD